MRTEILQRQSAVLLRILHGVWCLWPCLWIRKDRTRKALWATVRHGTHVLTSSKEIARRALAGLLALQSCHHPLLPHLLLLLLQSLLKLGLLLLLLILTKGETSVVRLLLLLLRLSEHVELASNGGLSRGKSLLDRAELCRQLWLLHHVSALVVHLRGTAHLPLEAEELVLETLLYVRLLLLLLAGHVLVAEHLHELQNERGQR